MKVKWGAIKNYNRTTGTQEDVSRNTSLQITLRILEDARI